MYNYNIFYMNVHQELDDNGDIYPIIELYDV
jgi:hypothetical protein